MEGVRTENYLRIRIYIFLLFRIRISITLHTQFHLHLNNLLSADFLFVFCRIFAGKVTTFLQKTRINIYIFHVQTRHELNEWVVRHALSPRAEPLPEYGREGMVAIREFYMKLADDEGKVQFYANHPGTCDFFTLKSYRVSF